MPDDIPAIEVKQNIRCAFSRCGKQLEEGRACKFYDGRLTCEGCFNGYMEELMLGDDSLNPNDIRFEIVNIEYVK